MFVKGLGGVPMKPILEGTYSFNYNITTNNAAQRSYDFVLAQSVDPEKCVATIGLKLGSYYSSSQRNHSLGLGAEIIGADTLRVWAGGGALHDSAAYYTIDPHIIVYEFGAAPKSIQFVRSAANGASEVVSPAVAVNRETAVLLNRSAGGRSRSNYIIWNDAASLFMHYALGCTVVGF